MHEQYILGSIITFLVIGGVLTLTAGFALVKLYRRSVVKYMRRKASDNDIQYLEIASNPITTFNAPRSKLKFSTDFNGTESSTSYDVTSHILNSAQAASFRAATAYTIAGLTHAAISIILIVISRGYELQVQGLLTVGWALAWPGVLTLNLLWGPDRKRQILTIVFYFGVLSLLCMWISAFGGVGGMQPLEFNEDSLAYGKSNIPIPGFAVPAVLLPLFLWALFASPTMYLLLFLNRSVRNVGPLILVFMLVALGGVEVAQLLIQEDMDKGYPITNTIFEISGLSGSIVYYSILSVGFSLFGILAWFVARWITHRYQAKTFSDQTILFDTIWMLATFGLCIDLTGSNRTIGWLGVFVFVAYKFVQVVGLKPLQREAEQRHNVQLLLLRVFSLGKRSQSLFDLLGARWRYVGNIHLIVGSDLATATLEPNEFLDFLGGKLRNIFIHNHEDLNRRLTTLDLKPDADGRYRVNEFFCFDNTWQMTVTSLIGQSDIVMMDLRSFSPKNSGCLFELQALIDQIPLGRVVLLIDHTNDYPFLEETLLQRCWQQMQPLSPNADSDVVTLQLLKTDGNTSATVNRLMLICDRIMASTCRMSKCRSPS